MKGKVSGLPFKKTCPAPYFHPHFLIFQIPPGDIIKIYVPPFKGGRGCDPNCVDRFGLAHQMAINDKYPWEFFSLYRSSKYILSASLGTIVLDQLIKLDFSAEFMKPNLKRSITDGASMRSCLILCGFKSCWVFPFLERFTKLFNILHVPGGNGCDSPSVDCSLIFTKTGRK